MAIAQYDLVIPQNTAATGIEFTERNINIPKGALLSGAADGSPLVLGAGTDTYILSASTAAATGLAWIAQPSLTQLHTQNTDTGTTSDTFTIGSGTANGKLIIQSTTSGGDFSTTLIDTAPTANQIITLPNATGIVALTNNKLSVFAATTSAELAGVISDETGTDKLVFNASPTFATSIDSGATFTAFASATALTIGNTAAAQTINLGAASVDTQTINIGSGVTATGKTKTINIGTGGATGSTTNINLGSAAGGSVTVNKDLVVTGDLTVNGTTTTINAATLTVDDKNIELGSVTTPTDVTADGGGITLKGATDKTIIWDNANDNWTFNQSVNLVTGTVFKINNVEMLSSTHVLGLALTETTTGFTIEGGTTSHTLTVNSDVTLGTMAGETATNYVANALYDANTVLYATTDNTPVALVVGEQTLLGRKTGGAITALTSADIMSVIEVAVPTSKTAAGTIRQIAFDGNFMYRCTQTGVAGAAKWVRSPMSTNW